MPEEASLSITLVHGEGAQDRSDELQKKFTASRVITDLTDVQTGDLLLLEALPDAWNDPLHRPWWAASQVLILEKNNPEDPAEKSRAPIVDKYTLEEALAL